MENDQLRPVFKYLNRYFMVPMFRLGLGRWVGNPFSGYIMVIKTRGRKTGRLRYTPVNYAMQNGLIYCMAGFGTHSDWYRNIQVDPRVEVILPSGTIAGTVEEVDDEVELRAMTRQVAKNSGFAAFAAGCNPFRDSDEVLRAKLGGGRLMRIRPQGVGSGPGDPGGWLWLVWVLLAGLVWLLRRRKNSAG